MLSRSATARIRIQETRPPRRLLQGVFSLCRHRYAARTAPIAWGAPANRERPVFCLIPNTEFVQRPPARPPVACRVSSPADACNSGWRTGPARARPGPCASSYRDFHVVQRGRSQLLSRGTFKPELPGRMIRTTPHHYACYRGHQAARRPSCHAASARTLRRAKADPVDQVPRRRRPRMSQHLKSIPYIKPVLPFFFRRLRTTPAYPRPCASANRGASANFEVRARFDDMVETAASTRSRAAFPGPKGPRDRFRGAPPPTSGGTFDLLFDYRGERGAPRQSEFAEATPTAPCAVPFRTKPSLIVRLKNPCTIYLFIFFPRLFWSNGRRGCASWWPPAIPNVANMLAWGPAMLPEQAGAWDGVRWRCANAAHPS